MSSDREGPHHCSSTGIEVRPSPAVDLRGGVLVALLAFVSSATSLANGFTYDDRPLILDNPRLHHLAHLGRLWRETYWPPWMGAGLYRPLTTSAFAVEWATGHGSPWIFHATNIALYVAVSLLVYALARLVLPRGGAWVAAAVFAVHPVHVEAVGNIVGQSELWAACGVVGAVLLFVRWRRAAVAGLVNAGRPALAIDPRAGALPVRFAARIGSELGATEIGGLAHELALVALVLGACLAKEHAVITPLLLVLAELLLVDDPRPLRARWRALRPMGLVMAASIVAYVAWRAHVIGGLAGDRPNVVLEHLSPGAQRWTMLGIVSEWVRLLVWPARLVVEYAPLEVGIHQHFDRALVPDVALLALLAALLLIWLRRWTVAAFALLWAVISLLLVSNLIVPTGILLAERTLFLPSVGAAMLAGAAVARIAPQLGGGPLGRGHPMERWSRIAAALVACVLVAGAWRSARRQRVWRSNASLFAQAPLDAPLSYRAHDIYAGLLFDHGDAVGGAREARIALALYPHDPVLYRDLAQEYMRAGLCRVAIPLLRRSIAEPASVETDAHLLLAECLLAQHDAWGARDQVLQGVAEGPYRYYGAGYHKVLLAVDSAMLRPAALAHADQLPSEPRGGMRRAVRSGTAP